MIVIEFPKYVEIEYGAASADDDEIDVNEILERTQSYLTVFSACIKPVQETGRDKLILNASSTSSLPLGTQSQVIAPSGSREQDTHMLEDF